VTDRPRLVGWSSLHRARRRSLTPLVADAGTLTGSMARREAGSTCTSRCWLRVDPRDLDRFPRRTLRSCVSHDRDAFRRVPIDRVAPIAQVSSAFWLECAAPPRAPFSPRSRRCVRQHVVAEYPSASVASPIRLAAPRASRRAMRRTDFCLLTSSYEHPRLVGSRCVNRSRACAARWNRLFHGSAIRFGGQHVLPGIIAPGLLFPS